MKTAVKIGLGLLVIGLVLLAGLICLVVRFAVGGSHNPPLSSPLREFITFFYWLGMCWFVFVGVGVALLVSARAYDLR